MVNNGIKDFQDLVWQYYRQCGRTFPWRETTDPYAIWVSEIMLQQTQVSRVETKYRDFLGELPAVEDLAAVPLPRLLQLWQGLGYNRRALALQQGAQLVVAEYAGRLPRKDLESLPGIGPYTASAIRAFAFNEPVVMIETNIRRAFLHFFFPGVEGVDDKQILPLVKEALDRKNARQWYYALMDYGAALVKVGPNPNRRSAHYSRQSRFEGSNRQLRGQILRTLLERSQTQLELTLQLGGDDARVAAVLWQLEREGFVAQNAGQLTVVGQETALL